MSYYYYMESEAREGKPIQEKEKTINMGIFYLFLPGGRYREFKGMDDAEEFTQIMEAIDQLLATEFKHLDTERIFKAISEGLHAMAMTFRPNKRYLINLSDQEIKEKRQLIKPQLEAAEKAEEELRPLFDKLVAMGFDLEILRGSRG